MGRPPMTVTENGLAEPIAGLGAELRAEIAELRAEMERRFTEQTWQIVLWITAVMAVMVGAATSILIAVLG